MTNNTTQQASAATSGPIPSVDELLNRPKPEKPAQDTRSWMRRHWFWSSCIVLAILSATYVTGRMTANPGQTQRQVAGEENPAPPDPQDQSASSPSLVRSASAATPTSTPTPPVQVAMATASSVPPASVEPAAAACPAPSDPARTVQLNVTINNTNCNVARATSQVAQGRGATRQQNRDNPCQLPVLSQPLQAAASPPARPMVAATAVDEWFRGHTCPTNMTCYAMFSTTIAGLTGLHPILLRMCWRPIHGFAIHQMVSAGPHGSTQNVWPGCLKRGQVRCRR